MWQQNAADAPARPATTGGAVDRPPSRAFRPYLAAVCVLGLLTLALVLAQAPFDEHTDVWATYLLLALAVVVGELYPITVPRGDEKDEITASTTLALALVLLGPLWLAMTAQAAGVALDDARVRKDPIKIAFNIAQYSLTLLAARAAYAGLSGQDLLGASEVVLPDHLPAALAAGVAYFVVNTGVTATVASLASGRPVLTDLRAVARHQVPTTGVLLAFAPALVAVVQTTLWLLPLAVLPLQAIYISARLAAQREHEAVHDALTGLGNRALLRHRVRAVDDGGGHALLLIDLDHFKAINDTLGHPVGDDLLREVARRLRQAMRADDTVCRLGGDEFAVFGPRAADADPVAFASRITRELEESFLVDGARLDVAASVGVALFPEHGDDVDALLQRADIALYHAKAERGSVEVYDPAIDVHSRERLALATQLRDALADRTLFCVYQPKVEAATGRTVGLEALVRWQQAPDVVVMPDTFLAVAENTGLVRPLTMQVLDMALADHARWRDEGHELELAVNLSVRHLTDLELPRQVQEVLRRYGTRPQSLVLEVTETAIMSDPVRAMQVLDELRALGVGLAIDDFGTGYSSLSYLHRMHVDELKIDKSFVMGLADGQGNASIVRSTIELGHSLGLRLVAEGVEDERSLALVRGWGCDQVQGYLLSRPMPSAAVSVWLRERAAAATG